MSAIYFKDIADILDPASFQWPMDDILREVLASPVATMELKLTTDHGVGLTVRVTKDAVIVIGRWAHMRTTQCIRR